MAQESWSDYWRLGGLTTLNHFRDGYAGELAAFWHRLVDELPDGAAAVDLATGNGAVPLVLLRHARAHGKRLVLEGVDAAQIDPVAHAGQRADLRAELSAIRFHPGTPLERSGLPAGGYHLVSSQYGIEYGDLGAATNEIARLLAPGGWFGAIMHSTDSNVARTAANIDALLSLLLDELDMPGRMRRMLTALGECRDRASLDRALVQPEVVAARAELDVGVRRSEGFAAADQEQYGTLNGFLQRLFAPLDSAFGLPLNQKFALIEQLVKTSQGLRQRMRALRESALDAQGLDRFLQRLRDAGLEPEPPRSIAYGPQREAMGYGVVARRPA